jgi:hypothetical protein
MADLSPAAQAVFAAQPMAIDKDVKNAKIKS